jgi:hypothetical protein
MQLPSNLLRPFSVVWKRANVGSQAFPILLPLRGLHQMSPDLPVTVA